MSFWQQKQATLQMLPKSSALTEMQFILKAPRGIYNIYFDHNMCSEFDTISVTFPVNHILLTGLLTRTRWHTIANDNKVQLVLILVQK